MSLVGSIWFLILLIVIGGGISAAILGEWDEFLGK